MKFGGFSSVNHRVSLLALVAVLCVQIYPLAALAQNTGSAPVFNRAVQGQVAAQPEGTLLNVINWIGNVVAPLLAVGAVVMAVVSYSHGRGVMRWAVTAVGLLMISGLTRFIEAWITSGTQGVQ